MNATEKKIHDALLASGMTEAGVCGLMGNLYAESGMEPCNMENQYESDYNDATYTAAVDSGEYTGFVHDRIGYGLAQWTASDRKKKLLMAAQKKNTSIGDLDMQIDYLIDELKTSYPGVMSVLCSTDSVRTASDIVMCKFEIPADQSEAAKAKRAEYGARYYSDVSDNASEDLPTLQKGASGAYVIQMQLALADKDYLCKHVCTGVFDNRTLGALMAYQVSNGLVPDGICGPLTWAKLAVKSD